MISCNEIVFWLHWLQDEIIPNEKRSKSTYGSLKLTPIAIRVHWDYQHTTSNFFLNIEISIFLEKDQMANWNSIIVKIDVH